MSLASSTALTRAALPTSFGYFEVTFSDGGVTQLKFPHQSNGGTPSSEARARHVAEELDAYLRGELTKFSVQVDLRGTPFQLRVWNALREIPYGEVRSYAAVAAAIGRPSAVRAVGAANGANPVPVIVPCHRVIGADGRLVGFGGGLDWKRRLLGVEAAQLAARI